MDVYQKNSLFAEAVRNAGIAFVSPTTETISIASNKVTSKVIASDCNILHLLEYQKINKHFDNFHIITKTTSSGSEKKIKVVSNLEQFTKIVNLALDEALFLFKDEGIFCE